MRKGQRSYLDLSASAFTDNRKCLDELLATI